MSTNETVEQEAPAAEAGAEETVETPTNEEGKSFDLAYVQSLRQEAAKYRTQAKDLATKASAYDEYVESQKSEQQKKDEALAAAQAELAEVKASLLRNEVAASKQLPPSLVARLRGETKEELEADADALLADLKGQFAPKQKASSEQTGAGVVGESTESFSTESYLEVLSKRS